MLEEHVDENGEVLGREEVIARIESLLNRVDEMHYSSLSLEVMSCLEFQTLVSILKGLESKSGQEISSNQEWLFGLVD